MRNAVLAAVVLSLATVPALLVAQSKPASGPAFGIFGFDTGGMDRSVRPGDNFYLYANGAWLKANPIPADKSNYGIFTALDDLSRQRTQALLEAAKVDPASKIGAAYASYLDQATVEAKGLAPIQPWLDEIRGLASKAGYPALLARAGRIGAGGPIRVFVGQDDKAPESYIVNLGQGGLGMPDRDYYLVDTPQMAAIRTAYVAHLSKMLALAGEANAEPRAKAIMDYETAIAKVHWTRTDSRDADKTYNKMTIPALAAAAPGFDFRAFLRSGGKDVNEVLVAQPSALSGQAKLIATANIDVLKDQLLVNSLNAFSDVLPDAVASESFAFFGTALSGTPEREARWKRAVNFTTSVLPDEVGKVYVARHFPPETKKAADTLVKNVMAAMGRRIDALSWMSAEAKRAAHAKLANFTPKIGYPDRWRDFSGLEIRRDDLFGNRVRSNRFEHDHEVGKLGKPIYRWEWGMTPMTVNAYANFGMVEIVFPAAILQPPFFDPKADPAVNYGGIGAVIGHELSHHFDDQGAKYDRTGKLVQWWTDRDVKNFNALNDKLVAQYASYEIFPGVKVNGRFTLGENSADLAGLAMAYEAYRASLKGKGPPVIAGTTGDQRFFLGWAQVWRRNYREPNLRNRIVTDPHAPSEQRVWIVRNMDAWYKAYDVKPGDKMYLPPQARVKVW